MSFPVTAERIRVRIEPRGAIVLASPGALLLDLLRDAGLPISYSCQAGRCGTCRCDVLDGDVLEEDDREFRSAPLPDARRQVLACRTRLIDDCTIGLVEPDEVIAHPAQLLKCRVERVETLNATTLGLWLRPNRALRFSAGQFVKLDFGVGHVRPYSIASVADEEALEFHLRRMPGGRVTTYVAEHVRVGHSVKLTGPLGTSYLRRKHAGPMLCIAGGTGLAPILSIVRTALADGPPRPIHIYVGARTEADLYGIDQLRTLASEHAPTVQLALAVDTPPAADGVRHGLITDIVAADLAPRSNMEAAQLTEWKVYVAGPPPMVAAAVNLANRLGAHSANIHADAFFPTRD